MEKYYKYINPAIAFVLTLLIGYITVNIIKRVCKKILSRTKLDISLQHFLCQIVSSFLFILVLLSALSSVGVSTTGLVATLSAGVVGIAVALKDSLGNIAGGILLLLSPRFTTGDYIEVDGSEGTVEKIDLLHTTVLSADKKHISIPNGLLLNSHITNYTHEPYRRIEIIFSVAYDTDIELAKSVILETVTDINHVSQNPEKPFARVKNFGSSGIDIACRVWCEPSFYWDVYFDINEKVKESFDKHNIVIPYNQLDVNIKSENIGQN